MEKWGLLWMEVYSVHSYLDNSRYCAKTAFSLHALDISSGELNTSPKLGAYTPALFTLSSTRVLVPKLNVTVTSPAAPRRGRLVSGYLFFGPASRLDAFSVYPLRLSYSTLPCQTIDTP